MKNPGKNWFAVRMERVNSTGGKLVEFKANFLELAATMSWAAKCPWQNFGGNMSAATTNFFWRQYFFDGKVEPTQSQVCFNMQICESEMMSRRF